MFRAKFLAKIKKKTNFMFSTFFTGHIVVRYKPKSRGFDSQCCQLNFLLTKSFLPLLCLFSRLSL